MSKEEAANCLLKELFNDKKQIKCGKRRRVNYYGDNESTEKSGHCKAEGKGKSVVFDLEGSVVQRNSYARLILEKNSVIGISEMTDILCDYVARQDSVLAVFFRMIRRMILIKVLNGQESMRGTLLRAALKQRQMLLEMYAGFQNLVRQFHSFVEAEYNDLTMFCSQFRLERQSFNRMDNLNRWRWYISGKLGGK